jgi:acetylserotonin N-methyltransferase
LFGDPLPGGCDTAVVASVLHDFSPERAQRILQRAFEALPPDGRLVVMEIAPDEDRSGPPLAVAFALTMIVNTAGGDAYTPSQYRAVIEAAGFTDVRTIPLGGALVTTAFEAQKAG